jgi:ADP-ribosylglycohydrolase
MEQLREKFLGSIVGCAVGDALGAPYEGALPLLIRLNPEQASRFQQIPGYPLGQYTDDTQLTMAIMRAVCRVRAVEGSSVADEFVRLWQTGEIVGAGASCSTAVRNMLTHGMSWDEAGTPQGRAGNGTAMRAAPVGLWNYAHLDEIEEDARITSIITHKDTRSIGGTIAVAVAVALCVGETEIDSGSFLETIGEYVRGTSELLAGSIEELPHWLRLEPQEAMPHIYAAGEPDMGPRNPPCVTPYVIPTIICALYCFLKSPHDYMSSVVGAINAGGDTDTVAAITGAISGALNGISAIPEHLVRTVKDSEKISALAEEFYELTVSRN